MLMVFMKIIVKCYRKKIAFGGSWGFWNFGWDPWICKRKLVVYNSIQYNHRHKQTCRPIQIWSLWVRTQTESAISGILLIFSLINYLKYGNMALYELNVSLRVVIMNFVAGDVESIYKEQLFITPWDHWPSSAVETKEACFSIMVSGRIVLIAAASALSFILTSCDDSLDSRSLESATKTLEENNLVSYAFYHYFMMEHWKKKWEEPIILNNFRK